MRPAMVFFWLSGEYCMRMTNVTITERFEITLENNRLKVHIFM